MNAIWVIDYDLHTDKCYNTLGCPKCNEPIGECEDGKFRCFSCGKVVSVKDKGRQRKGKRGRRMRSLYCCRGKRMTLEEAIKHCEEVAEIKKRQVENGDWEKGSMSERDCLECEEEHRQLAEWLKELKKLRAQTRWISVSERLPNFNDIVLASADSDYDELRIVLTVYGGEEYWFNGRIKSWMPLPEPYKAEIEEEE